VFATWTDVVRGQELAAVNRIFRSVATLLLIVLLGVLLLTSKGAAGVTGAG